MNFIRSVIQKFGLDIHRYRPEVNYHKYLKNQNINTILDIGANVGQFAKKAREILPNIQIYSFEPIKECFNSIELNFKEDNKFKAFNFALGDKEEVIEMNKSVYTPSSSILPMTNNHKNLFPHTKDSVKENIKIKTLDSVAKNLLLNPNILIKVDVQGFEDKVIDGGIETFKKAKIVLIENSFIELYNGQPLFDDIYTKLKILGFKYKGSTERKMNKHTGEIVSEDSIFEK